MSAQVGDKFATENGKDKAEIIAVHKVGDQHDNLDWLYGPTIEVVVTRFDENGNQWDQFTESVYQSSLKNNRLQFDGWDFATIAA